MYALYFFSRVFFLPKQSKESDQDKRPVSIIICAKNEARNLENNLPSVLSQLYHDEQGKPLFEVIVVNDASNDDTEQVLHKLEQQHHHLWNVTITPDMPRIYKGKKFALHHGVKHASHSLLLLTDADCIPASSNWLGLMTEPLRKGKDIVAGYSGYQPRKGLLNAFIRWETMHTFLQYACYTVAEKPYMAVGRNLACKKEIFLKAQQSEIWNAIQSGDDDLLIRTCAGRNNMTVVSDKDALTFSEAKSNWNEWLHQKQRHVSTGKFYTPEIKFLLGVYACTHALAWLLFFVLVTTPFVWEAFYLMTIRLIVYWLIWTFTTIKLKENKLLPWIPLCDLGWAVYNFVLSPYIIWQNKKQWK